MAQVIDSELGSEELRELVRKGSRDFFEAYRGVRDPLMS